MISLDEAISCVLAQTRRLSNEYVDLERALGCVLSQPIVAREPHPPFTSSAVDGFAVRSADTQGVTVHTPVRLSIIGEVMAGGDSVPWVYAGTTVRVMTGAPVPDGADAVVMLEEADQAGDQLLLGRTLAAGENVRLRGEEFKEGHIVLLPGSRIDPGIVALLAALGYARVPVYQKPRVCVITTGNELVPVDQNLRSGELRDANGPFLESALRDAGIDHLRIIPRVEDEPGAIREAVSSVMHWANMVIITGGVSVGDCDFVRQVFREIGIFEHFWRIAVKPGKPALFGTSHDICVFGLPGNPVAVEVLFYELVWPALFKMMGCSSTLRRAKARIKGSLTKKTQRMELVRGRIAMRGGDGYEVIPCHQRESHMLSSFAGANCLIRFPLEKECLEPDEWVDVDILPWADTTSKEVHVPSLSLEDK